MLTVSSTEVRTHQEVSITREYPGYDTKLRLIVEYSFIAITPISVLTEVVAARVPSIGQIDGFFLIIRIL